MLPRADGVRTSDFGAPAFRRRFHEIRHQPVGRPVAAADHVAGPSAGQQNPMRRFVPGGVEKTAAITGDDQLHASFAGAVRVVAAHWIGFAAGAVKSDIFVAFVAADRNHGLDRRGSAHRLQHIDGSNDVDLKSDVRFPVAAPNQRLSGEMKNDFRFEVGKNILDLFAVPDVGKFGTQFKIQQFKVVGRLHRQCDAANLRSELPQP